MFAYPCGGENGASSLTFVLFAVGAGVLWRREDRGMVAACVVPFGVAIVAAALKRYPYGGPVAHGSPARVMQYLAPGICLVTGVGAAALLARRRSQQGRRRLLAIVLAILVVVGSVPVAADLFHPYRSMHAQRARQFARDFWPSFAHDADALCLLWDVGIGEWDSTNLNVAVYLCNQMIYSPPRRRAGGGSHQPANSRSRPVNAILPFTDPADRRVAAWLRGMTEAHESHWHANGHRQHGGAGGNAKGRALPSI